MKRLFVKLDVDYGDNPRMMAAGEKAELLYVRSLCLSKRMLSDGFIPDGQLVRFGLSQVTTRANALVAQGLWERVDGGYQIVGWLERNPSSEVIEERSRRRAEAGRRGGMRSGEVRKNEPTPKQVASES